MTTNRPATTTRPRVTPMQEEALTAAARHPQGTLPPMTGVRTAESLRRRGLAVAGPHYTDTITDAGRAAVGAPVPATEAPAEAPATRTFTTLARSLAAGQTFSTPARPDAPETVTAVGHDAVNGMMQLTYTDGTTALLPDRAEVIVTESATYAELRTGDRITHDGRTAIVGRDAYVSGHAFPASPGAPAYDSRAVHVTIERWEDDEPQYCGIIVPLGTPVTYAPAPVAAEAPAAVSTRPRSEERTTFLADVLCVALEGGVGYWSAAADIVRVNEETGMPVDGRRARAPWRYDAVTLFETADGDRTCSQAAELGISPDAECPGHRVTLDDVASAVSRISKTKRDDCPDAGGFAYRYVTAVRDASMENDAGEIDADAADIIVQVAALGSVVYG